MVGIMVVALPLWGIVGGSVVGALLVDARVSLTRLAFSGCMLAIGSCAAVFRVHRRNDSPRREQTGDEPLSWLWWMLRHAWRALGWRLAGSAASSVPVLLGGWFYARNNVLTDAELGIAGRLVSIGAITLQLGTTADLLAYRRPPWPWSLSLPSKAMHRVAVDVAVLGAIATVTAFAAARVTTTSYCDAILVVPFLTCAAVALLPRARTRITGVSGPLWLVGTALAVIASLTSWSSFVLSMAPILFLVAVRSEPRGPATTWIERSHGADGDSQQSAR
jgi:hypothetical protein